MKSTNPQITVIAKAKLFPSPTNPRKKFDEVKLDELRASIEQRGVKSPLLVRPVGDRYEIVAGERRFRAGQDAKLEEFPCIVEEMSDADVLELQLIENLQREDLDPLEESEHYHRMLQLPGENGAARFTVTVLAEKIGKPEARIRKLLKLRELPKNMRTALAAGEIGVHLASIVARIPGKAMREKAAGEILNDGDGPMSHRAADAWIHENYMVEIKGAPFDHSDADLVPAKMEKGERIYGGSCEDCPLRTGNNREVYGDVARGDICTNPQCYALKRETAWKKATEAARSEGKKVLSEKESQSLFYYSGNDLAWNSSFYELDKQPPSDLLTDGQKGIPTWRRLIDGGPCKVEVNVVRTPRGKILEIADRKQLLEAAKKNGHEKLFEKNVRAGSSRSPAEQKAAKAEREKAKIDSACTATGFAELRRLLEGQDETPEFGGHPPEFWLLLLENAMHSHAGSDGQKLICRYLDLKPLKEGYYENRVTPLVQYARTNFAKDSRKLAALTVMVLLSQSMRWSGLEATFFKKFADWTKLDIAGLKKRVEKEIKGAGKKAAAMDGGKGRDLERAAKTAPKKKAKLKTVPSKKPAKSKPAKGK